MSPFLCAILLHSRSTSNVKIAPHSTQHFRYIVGLSNMAENGEIKSTNGTAGVVPPRDDRRSAAPGTLDPDAAQAPWSVEAVVAGIPGGAPETNSSSPVPFFHMLERLKTTKREGWRRFGIKQYALLFPSEALANRSNCIAVNRSQTTCTACP